MRVISPSRRRDHRQHAGVQWRNPAQLCLDGLGRFHVEPGIAAGTLMPVLEDFNPGDIEIAHAAFAGHEHLAARIRAFIDFLAGTI